MSSEVICSTGVLVNRNIIENYTIAFDYIKQLDQSLFELILYPQWRDKYKDIIKGFSDSGKIFKILHCEKKTGAFFANGPEKSDEWQQGIKILEANCKVGQELGAEKAVLHLWELPYSDEKIDNNLKAVEQCSNIASRHGMHLCVETIPCKVNSPLKVLKRVVDSDLTGECSVTLDLKHIAYHGEVDRIYDESWIWSLKNPAHFHIRDYIGDPFDSTIFSTSLHPGEGSIDFTKLFNFIKNNDTNHTITLEASGITNDGYFNAQKVMKSLNWIKEQLK